MRISLSLIKYFIDLDLPLTQVSDTLTLLGIEVDKIINQHPPFQGVVVGEVLSAAPHPNANKLQVATVTDGQETFQVVCGAPNCREGIKTAFAKTGAVLTGSAGKPLNIGKSSIRGIDSHGMLCSEAELSLSDRHEGICEFPREMDTGADLLPLLWNPVFEISLTPNLGHCMSALGIARELSAALQLPLKRHHITLKENGSSLAKKIKVTVEKPDLCPRYMCRLIENVKIGPSPLWLQRELMACGLKPISNAVDVTNFILLKRGQPLHAFDFDRIETQTLKITTSKSDEIFLGLDGIERKLPEGTLLICDHDRPLAIAGILGGEKSAVNEQTQNILIEAAYFDPMTVRKTAKALGLRTESSHRFEKGTDPVRIAEALDEACLLLLQICGGRLAEGVVDIKAHSLEPKRIDCRLSRVNKILGTPFSLNEIETIFHRLGFTTETISLETLRVDVPLFRSDISEEIDLVEEVARIYGYNNLDKKQPTYTTSYIPHDPVFLFEKEVRQRLIGLGLQEFLTSDLISPKLSELSQELIQPDIHYLTALHAKTEEFSILRPSLLPGLMQTAQANIDHKNQNLKAFEMGRIHFLQKDQVVELPMAALLLTGKKSPIHWNTEPIDFDFYDLKGLLENLFEGLKISNIRFEPSEHLSFHPYQQAHIYQRDLRIGSLGQVHPALLAKLDIKQKLFFAEIELEHLMHLTKKELHMTQIVSFPASERDWTISLGDRAYLQPILDSIHSFQSPLLEKTEVLDLYNPETTNLKNITLRFTYRDKLKTISLEEVELEHTRLIENISKLLAK